MDWNGYKRCWLIIIVIHFGACLPAQAQEVLRSIDSLKGEVSRSKVDTMKGHMLYDAAVMFLKLDMPDSTIAYGLQAAGWYDKGGDKRQGAITRSRMASLYQRKGAYSQAIELYQQAKATLATFRDNVALRMINMQLAGIYERKGDARTAFSYYQENIDISRNAKDDEGLLTGMSQLQSFYNEQHNEPMALKTGMEVLELARKTNNRKIMAHTYLDLGNTYYGQGKKELSLDYYKQSLSLFNALQDTTGVAMVQRNIGSAYSFIKQYDSAIAYLGQAQKTYEASENRTGQADILNSIASVYFYRQQYAEAAGSLKAAIALTEDKELKLFYRLNMDHILGAGLADANKKNGRLTAGEQASLSWLNKDLTEALTEYETTNTDAAMLQSGYTNLAAVRKLLGDYEGALRYFEAAIGLKDSLNSTQKQVEFAQLESKFTYEALQDSLKLVDDQQRLELQKEIELKALRYEYERKQAAARSEEERRKLILEEEFKRQQIEAGYVAKQKEVRAKYDRESALARVEQEKQTALANADLKRAHTLRNMSLLGAGLFLLLAGTAGRAYYQKRKDNKVIAEEQGKSEALLLNILPAEIAEELKRKGESKAQQYEMASVLFTDFVNFTQMSDRLGVEGLLEELNINFTAFDGIMEKHGLEKIKTIGDAYLAVSGLPVPHAEHAQKAVGAALDILAFVDQRKRQVPHALDIRIGIHSGSLIAGIVGVKKFAYDIWGDTVNTASRMESSSEPGQVNISQTTYDLVKDQYHCTYRGKINAKNKGDMDMYFVKVKN